MDLRKINLQLCGFVTLELKSERREGSNNPLQIWSVCALLRERGVGGPGKRTGMFGEGEDAQGKAFCRGIQGRVIFSPRRVESLAV